MLDFGLAKAIWGPEGKQDLSQLAVVTGVESVAGQLVVTPGYMGPEQARGKDVDKRTDIWAFGCLNDAASLCLMTLTVGIYFRRAAWFLYGLLR